MAILGNSISKIITMIEQFKNDVNKGLNSSPKFLSSKYFYDEIGDKLFVKIMNMPEYYLTDAEYEIFQKQTTEIAQKLQLHPKNYFELIELGAGDGTKTKELLKLLQKNEYNFDYIPIDISQSALDNLEKNLNTELPNLKVKTQQGDYFQVLSKIQESHHPKAVLFLGSNIGNLSDELAQRFLRKLGKTLDKNDKLLLGVDLIKTKEIVLPAYNDKSGFTKKFNLNLLERMNRELGANFNINNFQHLAEYDEKEGIAKSFLVSKIEQNIFIQVLDKSFSFQKDEKIHTEISRKYNDSILENILQSTDFEIITKITDERNYFADYILNRK